MPVSTKIWWAEIEVSWSVFCKNITYIGSQKWTPSGWIRQIFVTFILNELLRFWKYWTWCLNHCSSYDGCRSVQILEFINILKIFGLTILSHLTMGKFYKFNSIWIRRVSLISLSHMFFLAFTVFSGCHNILFV